MLSSLVCRFESYDTPQLVVYTTEAGLNSSSAPNALLLSSPSLSIENPFDPQGPKGTWPSWETVSMTVVGI